MKHLRVLFMAAAFAAVWMLAGCDTGAEGAAVNADASGSQARGHRGAPPVPESPELTPGNKEIFVSWKTVTGATSYEVWFCPRGGAFSCYSDVPQPDGETASVTITGLTNGTEYGVTLCSKNGKRKSQFAPSSVITLAPDSE